MGLKKYYFFPLNLFLRLVVKGLTIYVIVTSKAQSLVVLPARLPHWEEPGSWKYKQQNMSWDVGYMNVGKLSNQIEYFLKKNKETNKIQV